jgi:hypothetical protein
MSWSITLSGPKKVVARELSDAMQVLDKAIDWVQNSDWDVVAASLSGYVSWDEDGDITRSGVSFSVSGGESNNPKKTDTQSI